ncbi:MAG: TonB-dependent receptor [Acidobacteriia bacterium]|nr:TonB-dependent receptor [Terriglobia bacterium]
MQSRFIALGLALVLCTAALFAQSDRASITGTVKDSTGAMIPKALVRATNIDTNIVTSSNTNDLGFYTISNLPIGHYTLNVSHEGFKAYEQKGLVLVVSQIAEINAVLEVGAPAETVEVTANASLLQTQTATTSTNLTNDVVSSLPLNIYGGRSLSTFMFNYVPGVEGGDYDSHINGSLSKTKEVMIDGTSAVSQIGGYISESSPPFEAVEEFQASSTSIRAEEGHSGGGVFRYNMKSGTNSWHGSGFTFLHNEIFDANSWRNNYHKAVDVPAQTDPDRAAFLSKLYSRPHDRLYDWGGSFGGPIIKDKLFFFASAERYTFENYGLGPMNQTVPTTDFLNGNFGAMLDKTQKLGTDSAGNTVYKGAIFDPNTGNVFVDNMIPTTSFSSVSQKIVDIFKKYYQPLAPGLVQNNSMPVNQPAPLYKIASFSVKVDYNLSSQHRLNGSYIWSAIPRVLADQGGVWAPGTTDGGPFANSYHHRTTAPSVRFSESWTISNNLLNVFNVTFNRFRNPSTAVSQAGDWSNTLGLGDFGAGNFPIVRFNGINSDQNRTAGDGTYVSESPLGSQFNDFYAGNTYIINDNVSWVKGRHTFKFGADVRFMQFNSHGDYGVPTLAFDPAQTAGPYGGNAGFGFASFLLGDVNQASISEPNNTYGRRKTLSIYAQDDIKVTPKLTVNLDLRWDFNGRYHEKDGRWSNFNTTLINPVTGQPGALEFAKDGSDSFERRQNFHNFAPHIGAAYQLTPKTVVRGSYGIRYVPLNLNTWGGIPYGFNPGYVLNNQVLTPFNWDSGYPGTAVDVGKDPNFTRWGMVSIDPNSLELGNIQEWTVGIQRELTRDFRLDVNVIQNHGYHLQSGYLGANQAKLADYTAMVNAGQQWAWVTKPGYNSWSGFGWAAVQPFPTVAMTWGPLFTVGTPLGNSDYQSMQISLTKRTSHGLSMQASYNLSSAHGDTDTAFQELWWTGPIQDIYNLQKERHTIASFDQTHIVKGYIVYELPFGKGKSMLPDAGGGLNALVGGWTINGGFHYNSGNPLRITSTNWYPGMNNVYPNIVPDCNLHSGSFTGQIGSTYFNPACFANPAYGAFGNNPTYNPDVRGFGLATEDIGINKYFSFGSDGRFKLNVRYDMFNVFNRHSYAGPNTGVDANLGKILDGGGNPGSRIGQLGARFTF